MKAVRSAPPRPAPWFIPAVVRWRFCVLGLWLIVITASGGAYLSLFRIDNSVAIWFLEDDPELASYQSHNAAFGEREWTYVWLRTGSVYAPEFLRDLQLLGDRITSLENVTQVMSLTRAGGISEGPDGLPAFGTIHTTPPGALPTEAEARRLRDRIGNSPLFKGRLVPGNSGEFTVLAVQNANRIHAIEPYRIRLIDGIREAVAAFPAIDEAGIVGTTVVNAELNRAAKRDMIIYYALIAAFVLVGGGLALGSLRDLITLSAVVVGTVLPVLGAISALRLPFNLMTILLPTLLVTVGVSYLIHFLQGFHTMRREHGDTPVALVANFSQLLRPGFWTTLTTAIGFASLTASPVAPIRHIGFFAAGGIALAWLATITLAPALLSLLWGPGVPEHRMDGPRKEHPLMRWLARPHPRLAILLGAAMLAGAAGVLRLEADTNYVKFFRPGSTVRNDYARLARLGMPGSYMTITVRLSEEARLPETSRHRAMCRFEQSLLELPGVIDVESLDGMVAQIAAEATGDGTPLSPKYLLAMSATGRLTGAEEFLSDDRSTLRLRVLTNAMGTREINAFRDGLAILTARQPESWEITLTGTTVLWANMDGHVVRTQLLTIGITAVMMLVLLPVTFRSLPLGLLGFVVSFIPVLCTLGLMAWIGLPVNIATCILGGVVMGIAVDDTIYYLSGYRREIRRGASPELATRHSTMTTGRAMIKTSLILTGGFLTMTASDFLPSVFFGIFFAFSILTALLADLIVLPALLRRWAVGSRR